MIYEKSGKLANGQTWSWQFGGGVDLFAKDNPDNRVMVTYLNTGNDEVFEDELLDENFDPLFGGDKELRREYAAVCWSCYMEEKAIMDFLEDKIKDVARPIIKEIRSKDPNSSHLSAGQLTDIFNSILNTIIEKEGLDTDKDYWLIGDCGILVDIVDDKLEDYLMAHGFDLDY